MKSCITIIILLLFNYCLLKPCTLGVASGKATEDGRPMLWKTRDFEVKHNIIYFTETDTFNFVSNITPEYGYDRSWFGLNNKGFAIANTYIIEFPEGQTGMGNGPFMHEALRSCATVKDFINLLDKTNITGRKTRAVFGVIDTTGSACIFEVGPHDYQLFDANDENTAPEGYIIRSNFAVSLGGDRGMERYHRSSMLIRDIYKKGGVSVDRILKGQMRDLADPKGIPPDLSKINNSENESGFYFDCSKNICKPFSISATVVKGVIPDEPAFLSTLWAMLGNPFTSIATPYWAVGKTPEISASVSDSSLYAISAKIKDQIFNSPDQSCVNISSLIKIQEIQFPAEDSVLAITNTLLENWRKTPPDFEEMLLIEKKFSDYAYGKLMLIGEELIDLILH